MTFARVRERAGGILFLLIAAASPPASAESYPSRPVRIVIGFAAGAAADLPGRLIAQSLSSGLGQQFIIENRPGAGSNIAAEYVARAAADGYTLFMATASQTNYAAFTPKPTYDVARDFAPIVQIATVPNVLVAHPLLGVDTLQQLITLAKARPKDILFGSSGGTTTTYLAGILTNIMAGIELVHVPYPGSAQSMVDLLAGRIHLLFASVSAVMPHVAKGELKALAVTTAKRASSAPDIPTMSEAGLPGYDLALWFGLVAPAGTPTSVIAPIARITNEALKRPEVAGPLQAAGFEPIGGSPASFGSIIKSELAKAMLIAKAAGVRQ